MPNIAHSPLFNSSCSDSVKFVKIGVLLLLVTFVLSHLAKLIIKVVLQ